MQHIFDYNSKFMQVMLKLADMLILNLLFLLFCLPIVTIGASQAGLFSGIRQLMNKDDDSSCIKAFFKGFVSGFGKITLVHTLFIAVMALICVLLYCVLVFAGGSFTFPAWMCVLLLAVCALFYAMVAPFHASFGCTAWQLVRNMYFVVMAFIIRAVAVAVLLWLPVAVLLLDAYIFMQAFPIWSTLYYSLAYLFIYSIMKKPFDGLKQDFLDRQNAALPEATEPATEEARETE